MLNYYQHHLGDYAAATQHLSWDEDCAYRRLLDQYYKRELPIPADLKEACRLARATKPPQKRAVEKVLREFFTLTDTGWVEPRCSEAIATFQQGEPERQAAKDHRYARVLKHREERAEMFTALEAAGQRPPWNISITELRALARRFCHANNGVSGVKHATGPETAETLQAPDLKPFPATGAETPDTATHSHKPITNNQESEKGISASVVQPNVVEPKRSTARGLKPGGEKKIPAETIQRVQRVFDHWRAVHGHRDAKLDDARRRLIAKWLRHYSEADLCQSISGYRNSPHHMGHNDRDTVYDSLELLLRDAGHIDAGLKFFAEPPRTELSEQTRRIIDQTEDWEPPEVRSNGAK